MVSYVPVSRRRLKKRGYDQSRLLAEAMARRWNTEAETLLRKTRHTPAQSGLSGQRRRTNVRDAYVALPAAAGRRVLLVDDVVTTGSTLSACAAALRWAGAAGVVSLAMASPRDGAG